MLSAKAMLQILSQYGDSRLQVTILGTIAIGYFTCKQHPRISAPSLLLKNSHWNNHSVIYCNRVSLSATQNCLLRPKFQSFQGRALMLSRLGRLTKLFRLCLARSFFNVRCCRLSLCQTNTKTLVTKSRMPLIECYPTHGLLRMVYHMVDPWLQHTRVAG